MKHLLLLHGAIGSSEQLLPLTSNLNSRFLIHTLNFSGHGGNPLPNTFSIQRFAADVLNYLEQNKIEKINIFGYSMGGYVALFMALHHPKKIESVITFATKFLWTPAIALKEIKMLDAQKIEQKVPAFAQILKARHYPNDWKCVLQKTAEMMIGLGEANELKNEDFASITTKVLIGIGDKDEMVTFEESIDVYRKLQNAHFICMPSTPHPIEKINLNRLANEIIIFIG